ncbi:hypothetical protein DFH27DRAFT_193748 [Peziza echinospora]|nr:hypothetical protein DFH27DRAFT_193748 [Peziza echinospora]
MPSANSCLRACGGRRGGAGSYVWLARPGLTGPPAPPTTARRLSQCKRKRTEPLLPTNPPPLSSPNHHPRRQAWIWPGSECASCETVPFPLRRSSVLQHFRPPPPPHQRPRTRRPPYLSARARPRDPHQTSHELEDLPPLAAYRRLHNIFVELQATIQSRESQRAELANHYESQLATLREENRTLSQGSTPRPAPPRPASTHTQVNSSYIFPALTTISPSSPHTHLFSAPVFTPWLACQR